MSGDDVLQWEYFLRGRDFYWLEVDGKFDEMTKDATRDYQGSRNLNPDGEVGRLTYGVAMTDGFDPLEDDSEAESGPNWPPRPDFSPLGGDGAKAALFGQFQYKPAGIPGNPEAITVLGSWYRDNIVQVEVPQLVGVTGTAGHKSFPFHRFGAAQFAGFFQAAEKAGLGKLVLSWGGSYSARFIRGSRTILSNHSFGSAFDINVPWNYLGSVPALVGKHGSVRKLVPIANRLGLYWGGHFGRKDGMHFEIAKLMSEDEVKQVLEAM